MNDNASNNSRTFISYTHDSQEHKDRVLELADRLRSDGVDCHLDEYEVSPDEGWPRWMLNQVEEATFVLVVCTETYHRRFRGKEEPGKGLGATWEGDAITQEIYENNAYNTKFIPVIFSANDAAHIPTILRSATRYRLDTENGYDDLYCRLTAQPRVAKPPLGTRRTIPPRNLRTPVAANPASVKGNESRTDQIAPVPQQGYFPDPLVLLYLLDGRSGFFPARKIEQGENLTLRLKPNDPKQSAYLSELRRQTRNNIAVAYGDTALLARINSVSQVMEAAGETWSVTLELPDNNYHSVGMMESSINGITPDEIAEMRVRRFLFNERKAASAFGHGDLLSGLMESYVSRANGVVSFAQSPLPQLYQNTKNDVPLFLTAARLTLVMGLKISQTIEHIFKLELQMHGENEVAISFQGQRPLRYQNAAPVVIEVEGVCRLS